MVAHPTRRAVIAAGAALPMLVTGCRGVQALGTAPRPAADVARLRAAVKAEELMVARYQGVLRLLRDGQGAAHGTEPVASATLAGLLAEHQAHLRQLRERLVPGSPRAAGSAPLRPPSRPVVPGQPGPAVSYLSAAERAASDQLLSQVPQVPPALAQLLASISASEASHVPVLLATGLVS